MEDILVPLIVFGFFGWFVKVIADYKLKKRLIELGKIDESLKYLTNVGEPSSSRASSLKWGMLLTALGLAVILGQSYSSDEAITIAAMALFSGIALVAYYFIAPMIEKS